MPSVRLKNQIVVLLIIKTSIFHKLRNKFLFLALALFTISCDLLSEQGDFLKGLEIAQEFKTIHLGDDCYFSQTRGMMGDQYFAQALKGEYVMVFTSEAGEFYWPVEAGFSCEGMEVGGLFRLKETPAPLYLWSTQSLDSASFFQDLQDPDYVKSLESFFHPSKPFVHSYYNISPKNYQIQ